MIEIPIVSVLGEGQIEWVRLNLVETDTEAALQVKIRKESPDLVKQLTLARQIASFLLTRPYVRPLATNTLERGRLVAEFEGNEGYEGGSFGLALLAGCLALGLQVPIRKGRLFSAALAEQVIGPGLAGGGCQLNPVAMIGHKLAAACLKRQERLYILGQEKSILEYERAFWRGDIDRCCLPCVLPTMLPTVAVALMALDMDSLLQQVRGKRGEASLLLLALSGLARLGDDVFVQGIGASLARCRGERMLEEESTARQHLVKDMGMGQGPVSAEAMLACLVSSGLEKSSTDEIRMDLMKAAVSSNPELPLFLPQIEPGTQDQSDLDLWLGQTLPAEPTRLLSALEVLKAFSQLVPDMAAYWPRAKRGILEALEQLLEWATTESSRGGERTVASVLGFLNSSHLIDRISHLQPEWITEVLALVDRCLGSLQADGRRWAAEKCCLLCADLHAHDLSKTLRPILDETPETLALTFHVVNPRVEAADPMKLGEGYGRVNDLDVVITGPQALELVVPSPVLLMDSCFFHYSSNSFCRRRTMALADDALSHFPFNDAQSAWTLFGMHDLPTRIGFQVRPEGPPASIRWNPSLSHWPPAIDSQLLVATLAKDARVRNPRRLLDVGCGTGYLGIAAAHHWPGLAELHFLDIDPLALAVAVANAKEDPLAGGLDIQTCLRDFRRFRGAGFDVLLCAPPYLPHRPAPAAGIELATNGTILLKEVVQKGWQTAKEVWLAFSAIAWPEFEQSLAQVPKGYSEIEILRQDFCPFRLPWLEPMPPEDDENTRDFDEKRQYYENVLIPRGLIDMDNHVPWGAYVEANRPTLPENCTSRFVAGLHPDSVEKNLDRIEANSRGYRFWHEVRVVRLSSRSDQSPKKP